MLEGWVDAREAGTIFVVLPRRFVVRSGRLVPAREVAVLETEALRDQEGGVRVGLDVVVVIEPVRQRVLDEAAQKRNVTSGPDRNV